MSTEHQEGKCWVCQKQRILDKIGAEDLQKLSVLTRKQKKVDSIFSMLEQAAKKGISKQNDNLTPAMMDQMACDEFIEFLKHSVEMKGRT